ncbi:MAG: membrane protein [Bryobacteraceae bacterium]|nr:MAG: membrane protein [Bryobacteraceae bacterium]
MSGRRLRAVFVKELRHIARDWRSLAMALAVPLLLLLLFGYALTLDVDRIPTVIYDQDGTAESRELAERFRGSKFFQAAGAPEGYRDVVRRLDEGKALMAVVIPRGFARSAGAGETAKVQVLLDGSDSNTASIAAGYAEALVMAYSMELREKWIEKRGAGKLEPPADLRARVLFNNALQSKNFIVPGLIAVILMLIAAMLTSLTIAREWENGTMEQLLATPVRPQELLLGKLAAYFVLGVADTVIALAVGVGLFGVPMRGSYLLLAVASALFLFGALCWGIFLSTVARSQLLAYQAALITSFLPAFLLSGFVFAIENMPWVVQQVTRIVPARYFVTILHGIFMKGVGIEVLWVPMLFLLIYAGIVFGVASRKMRQKVA